MCNNEHIPWGGGFKRTQQQGIILQTYPKGFSHHESWNNWLLELGFEGVHQLFSFSVVERQSPWREISQAVNALAIIHIFNK